MNEHTFAISQQLAAALAEITAAAASARATIDGDIATLEAANRPPERPPVLANVPVEEPPAYVPPPSVPVGRALIPDTPLVDSGNSPAFDDDAPLWQS